MGRGCDAPRAVTVTHKIVLLGYLRTYIATLHNGPMSKYSHGDFLGGQQTPGVPGARWQGAEGS